jgi:prephenate dehydrogenase
MDLLVVGAGEMGRWFARTLADGLAEPPTVAFADRDAQTARAAAAAVGDSGDSDDGASDESVDARAVATDTDERFDVVAFAVPIPAVSDAVGTHADRAERALVDLSGEMRDSVAAMAAAAPDCERVSLHPLFAAANAPGNVAVAPDEPGPVTDRVRAALSAAGNDLFETTPAEHDRAMETVQARVHAAVLAFGLAAEDVRAEFQTPVSAALFETLETVTGNDPRVYADIQTAFDGAEDVAAAAARIAEADAEEFASLYREAGDRASADGDSAAGGGQS